jgi:hypothetical protein
VGSRSFRKSREAIGDSLLRHIGIYGYRAGFIRRYVSWAPSPLEQIEMLEQLRVLWYGEKIHVAVAEVVPGTGVDTPEDLERVARSCVNPPSPPPGGDILSRFSILFTSILISPDDNPGPGAHYETSSIHRGNQKWNSCVPN